MDTDSNVNVNDTSDITILLADVTKAEQTPNLHGQINKDSWATVRPVCKQDATTGTANHTRNGRAIEELVGGSKLRETGFSLSGHFLLGPSA